MAVKIRLTRMGAKKNPFYRIVVADSRSPRDGRFIEILGNYDSTKEPAVINVDEEKAIDWMSKGAQPTDTVRSLFSKKGIMAKFDEKKRSKN
ncbi:30S ribosomal protein S16 [Selenomonas sp.]|jgi:ribosomal protein S16|uniref:30S ribosomal protein S16 n=1 Tax=Selenomonas sp. TaxID=2053611 RepID=UPI0025EE4D64|nr:30S ribosomal protein S16 [uncultured Selenomonas sp.]